MVSEKFAEAFDRFKDDVDVRKFKTFEQLELGFTSWYEGHGKWQGTNKQTDALADEANKLGIHTEDYYRREQRKFDERRWREEAIMSEAQTTGFSTKYSSCQVWTTKTVRTTAYQRRISNYMWNHPNATLAEARGHKKRGK